jgi:hypothetical protein
MPKLIEYRIPGHPIGQPYYRQGTLYGPGEKVRLPADEIPPGWSRDKAGKIVPWKKNLKTGEVMVGKRHPHAWIELKPGVREKDQEKLNAVDSARQELADLQAQLEEKARLLEELAADAGEAPTKAEGDEAGPTRGVVSEDAAGDAGGEEPGGDGEEASDASDAADPEKKGRGGRRKRAADQDV